MIGGGMLLERFLLPPMPSQLRRRLCCGRSAGVGELGVAANLLALRPLTSPPPAPLRNEPADKIDGALLPFVIGDFLPWAWSISRILGTGGIFFVRSLSLSSRSVESPSLSRLGIPRTGVSVFVNCCGLSGSSSESAKRLTN